MASYLLTWNPKRWKWVGLLGQIRECKDNGFTIVRWSCGNTKQIKRDDRVYMIRLGKEPRCIFACGTVQKGSYEDTHWDEAKAKRGEKALFVEVRLNLIVNPETEPILTRNRLNSEKPFSDINCDSIASGIKIPDRVAIQIDKILSTTTGISNKKFLEHKNLFEHCVYAIRHSDVLKKYTNKNNSISIEEKRIWKTGEKLLNESKLQKKIMPIIFCPAEETKYLYGWAELTDIELNEKLKTTIYTIRNLKKFSRRYLKTALIKKTGGNIDTNYIRSYLVCKTPYKILKFLSKRKFAINGLEANDIVSPPERIDARIKRIIRDTVKSSRLKELYNYRCQICELDIKIDKDKYYIETHHVKPLGGVHKGIDNEDNMIVLCPNHHAMFDYGIPTFCSDTEVEINGKKFLIETRHRINREYIDYYNKILRNSGKF